MPSKNAEVKVLVDENLVLQVDLLFPDSSYAAMHVMGESANASAIRKNSGWKTFESLESEQEESVITNVCTFTRKSSELCKDTRFPVLAMQIYATAGKRRVRIYGWQPGRGRKIRLPKLPSGSA